MKSMSVTDFEAQSNYLEQVINASPIVGEVLHRGHELYLPSWYLGAGAVAQTVWNDLHGYPQDYGIKDCDIVYFDPDISPEAQDHYTEAAQKLFGHLPLAVEITNEARVHLWYKEYFGKDIEPYQSTEDAISTWPTTAASIGIRYEEGRFKVFAPFGMDDLMNLILRPNKVMVPKEVYDNKADRWRKVWPKLKVIPWDSFE